MNKKLPIFLITIAVLGISAVSSLLFITPNDLHQMSAPSMPTMGFMMAFMLSMMNTRGYFDNMAGMCHYWMGNMMNMMMGMFHSPLLSWLNIILTTTLILGAGALLFVLLILFVLWLPRR